MSNLYFWVSSLPMTFAKDYIFRSNCQKLEHVLLPNLVSTDSPGIYTCILVCQPEQGQQCVVALCSTTNL